MRAIMEPIFNILYLIIVLTMGITIIKNAEKDLKIFGYMAILLGAGDAFHLVPRIIQWYRPVILKPPWALVNWQLPSP